MVLRSLVLISASLMSAGCAGDTCSAPDVLLPAEATGVEWFEGGYASVLVRLDGRDARMVLDTAFPQSALSPSAIGGLDASRVDVDLAGAAANDVHMGVLLADIGEDGVLGGDVLHQLPLRFDARRRITEVLPEFVGQGAYAAEVEVVTSRRCRGNTARGGPAGPFALLVDAVVEGRPGTFVIDTGAHATLVRRAIAEELSDRPRLAGLRVASGFAGVFQATATRARTLGVGSADSPNALILSAPEVDEVLDSVGAEYSRALGGGRQVRVDGFLGWSFLREFEVELSRGASATEGRGIRLLRFDTQTHWTREFVGIGIYRAPSVDPPGIRVDDFLPGSPAVDLLKVDDVIVKVDGVPVTGASPISSSDGDVELEIVRAGATQTVTVPYVDLLPDP